MVREYELRRVTSPADWEAYHRIRRTILFEARGRIGIYDENGPDERHPDNQSLLLLYNGTYIGTVRLDCAWPDLGVIRLFAIDAPFQRVGHGKRFVSVLSEHAARLGLTAFEVNSAPEAVGFWQRQGFNLIDGTREFPLLQRAVTPPPA
jgi:N-acetylglutamate synthase-like GNAT family acetyltransferase